MYPYINVQVGNIETKFRTFPLEILAGEDDLNVQVRESGAVFQFNYAQVYWNSRLSTEHWRLIKAIVDQETERGDPTSIVCTCKKASVLRFSL